MILIIYPPSPSPSTSIRYSAVFLLGISGLTYWDLVSTQIKISIGLDLSVSPNTDLDLSLDQIPISSTRYTYLEKTAKYRILVLGFGMGGYIIKLRSKA